MRATIFFCGSLVFLFLVVWNGIELKLNGLKSTAALAPIVAPIEIPPTLPLKPMMQFTGRCPSVNAGGERLRFSIATAPSVNGPWLFECFYGEQE